MISKVNKIRLDRVWRPGHFLAWGIFFFICFWGGSWSLEAVIKGDINNDGRVDVQDSVRSLRMHVGTEPVDLPQGDLNYDNLVTPTDADLILKLGLGLAALPPDPGSVALPPDPTVATNLSAAMQFLYTGPHPIQTGVAAGTIDAKRAAVIRGKVMTREGLPLPGAAVTILHHPEYGRTLTRDDGIFDLVVNGGGVLNVNYQKEGYLPAQRPVKAPWQDYVWAPDTALVPLDARVTTIDLSAPAMQVARGSVQTDSDGSRQATLFFPPGTQAELVMPDGGTRSVTTLNVRATEYTVGPNGPQAMPAELPPTSGYTYAVELSVDEAIAAGAKTVTFSRPVSFYVNNFLGFPCGTQVPAAFYDGEKAAWIPITDGKVMAILQIENGLALLDTDGDQIADNGVNLGVTEAEREKLANLYAAGQSLWRVAISHFSPLDCNYPRFTTDDATYPRQKEATLEARQPDPSVDPFWGTIEMQNQIFGESIAITGTPFSLHYSSDRVPGHRTLLSIPLSGGTVPDSLKRIDLEVTVAGRKFTESFAPSPHQRKVFLWDGKDGYGRIVQGQQTANVRIGYVYPAYYLVPRAVAESFGLTGVPFSGGIQVQAREDATLWQGQNHLVHNFYPAEEGLGGWTLNVHHTYDPGGRTLYLGDGTRRQAKNMNAIITTVADNLSYPGDIAVGPDGSLYIADEGNYLVRRVAPDGTISTVAGNGVSCTTPTSSCGDGGPALEAPVWPLGIAVDPAGSLYISDYGARRIRKVGPDGIITRVAGAMTNSKIYNGDEIPALDAVICPSAIEVAPDGTIYFADDVDNVDNMYHDTVRRIGPDGIIHRYAGNGQDWNCNLGETCGDGGPAIDALVRPTDIALAPDGSLYILAGNTGTVRRVGTDGILETVAGKYDGQPGMDDGVPATETHFDGRSIALDRNGLLHIGETGWYVLISGEPYRANSFRVRRVGNDQIITTVAGGSWQFQYQPADENGPAVGAHFKPYHIALGLDGSLYISDYQGPGRVYKVHAVFKGFDLNNILIASDDGSQIYQFNEYGRHLKTINALTGATAHEFNYDANNRLISITDGNGKVTTINRDGNGQATAIVAPFGQMTALAINFDGYLASATNPASETMQFGYGPEGLLTVVTGPKGNAFTYGLTYDSYGRLVTAADPAGGFRNLTRTDLENGHQVGITTAMGRSSSYLTETLPTGVRHNLNTLQDGTVVESTNGSDGVTVPIFPDGTTTTSVSGPDPRFGMQAPLTQTRSVSTGGLTANTANNRTVTLTDPSDPLTLSSLTDTTTINGRSFIKVYDAATRTFTVTSPEGRQVKITVDGQGKIIRNQVGDLEATDYSYDSYGRLSSISTGSGGSQRLTSMSYNSGGYLENITNPLGQSIRFSYDLAGRVLRQTFLDSRQVQYSYDSHGNQTSLITPRGHAHTFSYSPVNLISSYTAPGPTATGYTYDHDWQPTRIAGPDGTSLEFFYDASGRIETIALPGGGQIKRTFNATTGQLSSVTAADGGTLSFGYNGGFLTSETLSGMVAGSVTRNYDNDFRVSSRSLNGGNTINYQYDADAILIGIGAMTLSRNAQNGLLTNTALGNVTDVWSYNGFGEPINYSANFNATPVFGAQYGFDKLGRIIQKIETIGGVTDRYEYGYDLAGRLEIVNKNGESISTYTYDGNGNRLTGPSGATTYTYDDQDRLVTFNSVPQNYFYTVSGELQSKTIAGQTTTYQYDALGNLLRVTLPGSTPTQIEYLVDGLNRRIGKKVNGTLVNGFLYGDQLSPVAELDGNNNLVSYFVYGSRSNVPDYMVKGAVIYRIISDRLGSPRLVVNTTNGAIAQRLDYDEFGRVLPTSTNLGFQPFGFAGGLYDLDTGLVRFGARDYDPEVGRWTAKDPIKFAGGDVNLYGYVLNNPVNLTDPKGLGIFLGGLPSSGLFAYLTMMLTSKWIFGSDDALFMARYGIEIFKEAYRAQLRLFGHLIHVAHNTDYAGWRGVHAAYDKIHAYLDRWVKPGAPGSGVAWEETPTIIGKVINNPYVKTGAKIGGKALSGAAIALTLYDLAKLEYWGWENTSCEDKVYWYNNLP